MKISIVIISFNKKELTKICLDKVFLNTGKENLSEVIVIDNNSTDGSQEILKKDKRIKVILNNKNLGFAKANNQGAKIAAGDLLIFLNNDTEAQECWLEPIIDMFKTENNIGAVGVKLLFPNGLIQHAGVAICEDRIPRHIYYKSKPDKLFVNKKRELQAVTAACIAISKKAYDKIGGFDEEFINGLEDIDLCLRLKQVGYRIFYQPKSIVIHHESVSPGRFKKNKHNADLYMSKWKDVEPGEHKIYREDGFGFWYILKQDLIHMAYSKDEYGTVPTRIKLLRFIYIPIQKIYIFTKLTIKLDFHTLIRKIRKAGNHG